MKYVISMKNSIEQIVRRKKSPDIVVVNRPEECIMDAENMAYPSNINTYSISIRRKKGKREKGKKRELCERLGFMEAILKH